MKPWTLLPAPPSTLAAPLPPTTVSAALSKAVRPVLCPVKIVSGPVPVVPSMTVLPAAPIRAP